MNEGRRTKHEDEALIHESLIFFYLIKEKSIYLRNKNQTLIQKKNRNTLIYYFKSTKS